MNGNIPVYKDASISLRRFHPDELKPTALYVVEDNIVKITDIAEELSSEGINIFNLHGTVNHSEGIISPPVIEMVDGVPAIIDGLNRIWWASLSDKMVTCIFVKGASLPTISYPVTWQEVVLYKDKPNDPKLLRRLREGIADTPSELRKYYRDFSYLGSKGRRPSASQSS